MLTLAGEEVEETEIAGKRGANFKTRVLTHWWGRRWRRQKYQVRGGGTLLDLCAHPGGGGGGGDRNSG